MTVFSITVYIQAWSYYYCVSDNNKEINNSYSLLAYANYE